MSIQHTRFIHCADLHLDSRMESHLSPYQAQNRRKELLQTFSRMVSYAQHHQICGILISGDLFDTAQFSSLTVSTLLHYIEEHPQIDFLYLPGNHDINGTAFFSCHTNWPENLWILCSSPGDSGSSHPHMITHKRYGIITITGLTGSVSQLPFLSDAQINLVMLHGQISMYGNSVHADNCLNYSLKDLSGRNIDYIAAGHIHQFQSGSIDSRGTYCYSGCLEGRGFDECGEKGFVLLDIAEDSLTGLSQVDFQFIPFAARQHFDLLLDVSGAADYHSIEQQVDKILSDIESKHLVRLKLGGRISPDLNPHPDWLLQKYQDDFYFLQIEDCTHPAICYEDYRYDSSLKGEFIRLVLSDSDLPEEDKEKIIMEGLHALSGEEILLNP